MSYQFPRDGYETNSIANEWGSMGQETVQGAPVETVVVENGDGTELKTTVAGKRRPERQPPFSFITDPTINQVLLNINPDLFVSKLFYFFFYSAFGSLFPLMAVYFKQLGMNPIQAGTLIGIRPFVEFIAAPFWSSVADKFHKCKAILLFSLGCWIIFTFSLAFIRPPASACVIFNETHHILYTPYSDQPEEEIFDDTATLWPNTVEELANVSSTVQPPQVALPSEAAFVDQVHTLFKRDAKEEEDGIVRKWGTKHRPPPTHVVGKSPLTVEYTLNFNQDKHQEMLSPPFSTVVYKIDDVKEVFFLLFLLVVLGEFFSAPAITLADSATLSYLGEDTDKYGQQRMYGSFGWGIIMFLVGIALDNSTKFKDHPCGPHIGERNYVTCFTIFAFLMSCTLLIATKFKFEETPEYSNEIQMNPYDYESSGPKPWQNTAPAINEPKGSKPEHPSKKMEFIDRWKSAVYAHRTRQVPNWVGVLRSMNNQRRIAFLFVTWFMGFGVGLVFTFLFWHLQDLGGTPTLYGVASVINHISEIGAYFYSIKLIKRFGHTKVLCAGLLFNSARFIYVAWLDNPWWVLPFELIQGMTHAAVWAAACSYIMACTEPELRSSAQGVMQGIYHGLGRGCGSILGGVVIHRFGSRIAFFLYGLLCFGVFGLFVHVNYYRKEEGYKFEEENVEEVVINDSSALAPHGVPTNPIARSVSRQNVEPNNGEIQPIGKQANLTVGNNYDSAQQYSNNEESWDSNPQQWDPNQAWN